MRLPYEKDLRVRVNHITRHFIHTLLAGSNIIVEATDSKGDIRYFTYRDFALATGELLDNVDHAASDDMLPLSRQKRRRATSSDDDNLEVCPIWM
jgi:hypothetical protein